MSSRSTRSRWSPSGPTSWSPGSRPAPARSADAEGFEAFELLKPNDDRDQFLVYTRWRSEEDFQAWAKSAAFGDGHKAHNTDGPVSTHAELWSFDVVQHERTGADS